MQQFYGTKLIMAEPEDKEGQVGYKVVYNDGYSSWSPAEVFKKAYYPINAMLFGHAIEALKAGKTVARKGWNGPGQWIALQTPDDQTKMKKPFFYICPTDKNLVPWVASISDMLAEDWYVVQNI